MISKPAALLALLPICISGCVSSQLKFETLDIGGTLGPMRSDQILSNIAQTISETDAVPDQFVISNGNANTALNLGPFNFMENFSTPNKAFSASLQNSVTGQWQFGSVNDPQDLQNLRALYRIVVNSEIIPPWANSAATITCILDSYSAYDVGIKQQLLSGQPVPASVVQPNNCYARDIFSVRPAVINSAAGAAATVYPTTADVVRVFTKGLSLGCIQYQNTKPPTPDVLYRRWLFWKGPDGTWQPHMPPSDIELASIHERLEPVGIYKGYPLWLTSRSCYNDFIVLDLASTAAAHAAANSAIKVTTPPAP